MTITDNNRLAYIAQISTLRASGWSWRQIGWELGYSREWARLKGIEYGIK